MNVAKKDTTNKKKRPDTYRLKFIDSYRFMASKLENLVTNLVEPQKNLPTDTLKQIFFNKYQLWTDNIDKFKGVPRKGAYPMNTLTHGENLNYLYL